MTIIYVTIYVMVGSHRMYTAALGFGTIVGWATFFSVLLFSNPEAGRAGILLFLGSLFIGLTGLITLLELRVRARDRKWASECQFRTAFRHGILASTFVVGMLLLSRYRVLGWFTAASASALLLAIEVGAAKRLYS